MICCRHVCPYHASRDVLNEGAALVFVTYSQLVDPPVRSANGLDDLLQGAVLVFDEVLHHLFQPTKNKEQTLLDINRSVFRPIPKVVATSSTVYGTEVLNSLKA